MRNVNGRNLPVLSEHGVTLYAIPKHVILVVSLRTPHTFIDFERYCRIFMIVPVEAVERKKKDEYDELCGSRGDSRVSIAQQSLRTYLKGGPQLQEGLSPTVMLYSLTVTSLKSMVRIIELTESKSQGSREMLLDERD